MYTVWSLWRFSLINNLNFRRCSTGMSSFPGEAIINVQRSTLVEGENINQNLTLNDSSVPTVKYNQALQWDSSCTWHEHTAESCTNGPRPWKGPVFSCKWYGDIIPPLRQCSMSRNRPLLRRENKVSWRTDPEFEVPWCNWAFKAGWRVITLQIERRHHWSACRMLWYRSTPSVFLPGWIRWKVF